jgi:hypothetical protein
MCRTFFTSIMTIVFCLNALAQNKTTRHEKNGVVNYMSLTEAFEQYKSALENRTFFVFPELRVEPLKWYDSIPEGRIKDQHLKYDFQITAQPGEFLTYQLGVWALKDYVQDVNIYFSSLTDDKGKIIPENRMTSFNKGGLDYQGRPFSKEINIPVNRIQPLWIGIDLEGTEPGNYSGIVTVVAGKEKQIIHLVIKVAGEVVTNHGYNEGNTMSRLNWLNSTLGIDDKITNGFQAVTLKGKEISILGRKLFIAPNGLPSSITSYFGESNQSLVEKSTPIVKKPFRFVVEKENGDVIYLNPGELIFTNQSQSKVSWKVVNTSDECMLECTGKMEFDGFVDYQLKLMALTVLKIKDIRLEIPVEKDRAEYMMGLGHEGGLRTANWEWKWDVSKNQDMLWVGAVNGGIRVKWKAENYIRPLVNIYYGFGPLHLPPSWGNAGKGGVIIKEGNDDVVINAFSGSRSVVPGDVLNYNFEMLITPFKVIDNEKKYGDRYFHGGSAIAPSKVNMAKKVGANVINIHHNEDIYPFINYPYLDAFKDTITQIVKEAHRENMRMKFYYTTRELTKNLPEFWAMYSLNGEVIFPGPGNLSRTEALHPKGPNEWYIHNLREKYIPAWYNLIGEGKFKGEIDLSVITTPDSRLNNFYIAGLDWMVQNMKIDGVYIDDSALDRFTIQRARKIIDNNRPNGRLDIHSWNHFNDWAGYANCLNIYMDLLPYTDLVWIGEGRDYNRMPDHWLIEVSGIPFGLPGQMLEGGGNPWRGMVYGITNRAGWTKFPPEHLWNFFDKYNFAQRDMIGYWEQDCPVTCSNPLIKASVFKGADDVIISLANWSETDVETSMVINWKEIGLNSNNSDVIIPEIIDFQEGKNNVSLDKIVIPGKKGYLILLKKKK